MKIVKWSESCSVVSDSLWHHGLDSPWNSSGQNTGVRVAVPFSRGSSQPRDRTQGLPHCRQILYQLSHQGSPKIVKGLLKCSFFLYLIGSSCEVDSASLITEQFFSQRKRNWDSEKLKFRQIKWFAPQTTWPFGSFGSFWLSVKNKSLVITCPVRQLLYSWESLGLWEDQTSQS